MPTSKDGRRLLRIRSHLAFAAAQCYCSLCTETDAQACRNTGRQTSRQTCVDYNEAGNQKERRTTTKNLTGICWQAIGNRQTDRLKQSDIYYVYVFIYSDRYMQGIINDRQA